MDDVNIEYYKEWIAQLPAGNITYKTINGKKYPYLQWRDTETGKQKSRIVKAGELEALSEKIEKRKNLEQRLKEAGEVMPASRAVQNLFSVAITGRDLIDFVAPVASWKKRECYSSLRDYVYGEGTDRIFILYGLRRTGKTTLIRQLIAEMSEEMLAKTAFLQINESITLAKINLDLKRLFDAGYRYLFIDEVTLMDDFIDGASLFSDVYATRGVKIVLSGTDSLGFMFSEDQELYDRCFMLHTTYVPYREFERVLGVKGIDEYIRYGGTMSLGGINYNQSGMTFATKHSTDEYVDSAIAHNIQHSLRNYQNGNHFQLLGELYEKHELTNAINRIVEDMNHRFTLEVLTRDFRSADLSLSAKNLLRDRNDPSDVLYLVDKEKVTEQLRYILEIKNRPEQQVQLTEAYIREIKEYLDLLDLTVELDVVYMADLNKKQTQTAISQPGLRYSQVEALVKTLMDDSIFQSLSLRERNAVTRRILSDVQGRMMEEIVLLETKMARPDCEVFKLIFSVGEFDMVVFDPETESCEIYEIKHSAEVVPQQARHLLDVEKCAATEHRYGTITEKYIIYRGENKKVDGIQYQNVEEYLLSL